MDCPYCNKEIFGWTGLQEAQNFAKHLHKCKKYRLVATQGDKTGNLGVRPEHVGLMDAVDLRAKSGQ